LGQYQAQENHQDGCQHQNRDPQLNGLIKFLVDHRVFASSPLQICKISP
jgi:hypothetical protein